MTVGGKLHYRVVCDTKSSWDTPIPECLIRLWNSWDIECPEQVEVPRSIVVNQEAIESIELHSFGVASQNGAVA